MSPPLVQNRETVIVPAGQSKTVYPASDYVQYQTVPAGLLVGINGGKPQSVQQATILQGVPGERQLESLIFENTTGGDLTALVVHGTGSMTVAGEAVLSGAVPLPSGASTAALQATANTSLAALDTKLGTLDDLAASTAETPGLAVLGATADQTYSAKKSLAVLNTNAGSESVTLNLNGGGDVALAPGQSVSWLVQKPLATLASVRVRTTGSGSALVAFTA